MVDRSKQFSRDTWRDPTRSLNRLKGVEKKLTALFVRYRKRVIEELKPTLHPFTQKREQIVNDCGAGQPGSPGFQPGNTCAKESGNGSPSENVKAAIKHYSALGGTDSSRYPATVEQTQEMNEWLSKGTVKGPFWRGEGYSEEDFNKIFDSKVEVGGEFENPRPTSFTRDERRKGAYAAGEFTVYYRLEGDAPGRDIEEFSIYKEEKEVLIAPNTKFKVVSRETKNGYRWYVTIKSISEPVTQKQEQIRNDCGSGEPGSPGFQPGNTCAKGSGNFDHEGGPGGLDNVHPDGGFGGYVSNPEYTAYLSSEGISESTKETVEDILRAHSGNASQQEIADSQIPDHWNTPTSPEGKMLRALAPLEEKAARIVETANRLKIQKEIDELERISPSKVNRSGADEFEADRLVGYSPKHEFEEFKEAWEEQRKRLDEKAKEPLRIYRRSSKTDADKKVLSFSTRKEGGVINPLTGGDQIFSPDTAMTLDELHEHGFKIISGFARQRGTGGEAEVIVIRTSEPHTQKAPQWHGKVDIKRFFQRLEDLTMEELIGPANAILEREIPDAFVHGTKYADINIKASMGIRLGAPLEVRQAAWKKIGDRVTAAQGEFKGVADATNQQIRRVISDSMVNESSYGDTTKAIQEVMESIGEARSRTIARTETMKAINEAATDRYEEAGVEMLEWLAAEDERTCEVCGERDGKKYPLDDVPECPAHPNCRCTLIPYVREAEEATQKREAIRNECGAGQPGSPGFQPGNTCAKGEGGGDHPAITKGYVKRGKSYTDEHGVERTEFAQPREGRDDFVLAVPKDKEQYFLDDVLKEETDRAIRRAEWERERVKEEARTRKIEERKLEKYRSMPALTTPRIEGMDRDKLDDLKKEIKRNFKEGIHESWARDAAEGLAIHPEASGKVIRDSEGKLHGVVTYTIDPKSQDVYIHDLASSGKVRGAGKSLMREVAKEAAAAGKGIFLQSYGAPDTLEFYERLKMHPVNAGLREHLYRFTPEEAKKFAETGVANKIINMQTHAIINLVADPHTQKEEPEQIFSQGRIL